MISTREYIDKLEEGLCIISMAYYGRIIRLLTTGMVITAGNGGSSATASHMANDLTKMVGIPSICLTDSVTLLTAYGNDDGYRNALAHYYRDLQLDGATLIVYSGSGNSHNIVSLVEYAMSEGNNVIAITGYPDNILDSMCDKANTMSICFGIDDMQVAEDLGLILSHVIIRKMVG